MRTSICIAGIVLVLGALSGCEWLGGLADGGYFRPGSSLATAAPIELDEEYRANLESETEEHWYQIDTTDDDIWDRMEVIITEPGEALKARISLRDGDNQVLRTRNASNRGANVRADAATQGGRHYLRITQFYNYGGAGSYTVQVTMLDLVDEYEPNDTRTDAYPLGTVPHTDIEATIVYSRYSDSDGYYGDLDWYSFSADSDGDIVVHITEVDEDLRIGMRAYNHDTGTHIVSGEAGNAGQTGTLTLENATAGITYSVGIYGARPFGSTVGTWGSYTMSIYQP